MGEIRMLNLFRRGLAKNTRDASAEKEPVSCIVTDYFDNIIVETLDWEHTSLSECMGIKQNANVKPGVSHQRYCLYSDEEDDKNIFGSLQEYPVLTVIQLFVNQDAYQAEEFEDGMELTAKNWMKKLETCLENSFGHLQQIEWKIYQVLTSGDFAVIVRSQNVHQAYDMVTLIRSIRLKVREKGEEAAAFYSYSICGIPEDDSSHDMERQTVKWGNYLEKDDQIVIRIRYEQMFRRRLQNKSAMKQELIDAGLHLLGRYDHQVVYSPEEFEQLYPLIRRYKFKEDITENDKKDIHSPRVKVLVDMMIGKHISHMNERLWLKYSQDTLLDGEGAPEWGLISRTWESLRQINNRRINKIKEMVVNLETEICPYYQSARNLKEYIRLTGRLCRVLYEINKMRELRLSAANLLVQYEDMVSALGNYVKWIDREDKRAYADMLEENLRYGIGALEIFTRYISNVNLQTLQTPNHDLQTNVCVEKVLLAYSQFLKPYMVMRQEPYFLSETLYPIIVPSMRVRDLSVVLLFHDMYKSETSNTEESEKLMVVFSPTFSFLCETCFLLPAAFHEIAHQFQFPDYKEQQDCLKKYVLKSFFHLIVQDLLDKTREYDFAETRLVEEIVDAVYDEVGARLLKVEMKSAEETESTDQQLFLGRLRSALTGMVALGSCTDKFVFVEDQAEKYIQKTKESIQVYDQEVLDKVGHIHSLLEKIHETEEWIVKVRDEEKKEKKDTVKIKELQKNLKRAAEKSIEWQENLKTAVENLKKNQERSIQEAVSEALKEAGKNELVERYQDAWKETICLGRPSNRIMEIWEENEKKFGEQDSIHREKIFNLLTQYYNIHAAYSYFTDKVKKSPKEADSFVRSLEQRNFFTDLCKMLHEECQKKLESLLEERRERLSWDTIHVPVPYLGHIAKAIRLRDEKEMRREVRNIFQNYEGDRIEEFVLQSVGVYREITADLFMCSMMDLNSFGYLVVVTEIFKFGNNNSGMQLKRVSLILQCLSDARTGTHIDRNAFETDLIGLAVREVKLLRQGIQKVMDANMQIASNLKSWVENACLDNMDGILKFFSSCPEKTGLTSTQKWILRVYHQVMALIWIIADDEMSENLIGEKEIWKNLTSEDAYYARRGELREVLEQNGDDILCKNISEILNSPASFFEKKKSIVPQEINFVISQYEKSCKNIFSKIKGA